MICVQGDVECLKDKRFGIFDNQSLGPDFSREVRVCVSSQKTLLSRLQAPEAYPELHSYMAKHQRPGISFPTPSTIPYHVFNCQRFVHDCPGRDEYLCFQLKNPVCKTPAPRGISNTLPSTGIAQRPRNSFPTTTPYHISTTRVLA